MAFGASFLSRRGARRVQKKKAHIAEAREQQAFSFFFFLFPALLQRFSVPVLHFFFSLSASPTFSVLSVLTRINFNRMPQQISNRSTPRILFGSSHTKKKKEKIHESSAFNIEQFAWSSVFRCCVFFFFSFVFLPFFTVVEDLVARRVCSFLFFFSSSFSILRFSPSIVLRLPWKCTNVSTTLVLALFFLLLPFPFSRY